MPGVDERAQELRILNNQRMEAAAVAVEMADVSLIFAFKQYLIEILEGLGHTILFPIAAGASVIRAILKIREAYLEKKENKEGAILRAAVETLAALAISTAVIGTFAAAATFTIVGPIIFTVALAAKSLFHLGSALYYGWKAAEAKEDKQKEVYRKKAWSNLAQTVITGLTTVACGLVLIAHKVSFGIMGIIGGALGAVYAIYKGVTATTATPPAAESPAPRSPLNKAPAVRPALQTQPQPANTATIQVAVRRSPEVKAEDPAPTASEQAAYAQLCKDLDQIKQSIGESMAILEHKVGGHHAFSNKNAYDGVTYAPINTYWWTKLYTDKYEQQPEADQALMRQIDASIKQYNSLLQSNAALLEKVRMQSIKDAAIQRSRQEERDAQEEREFRDRTGWSREDARAFADLAGWGPKYAP